MNTLINLKCEGKTESQVHACEGENVCENLCGWNYLERIPNYAKMYHNSSSFNQRNEENCGESAAQLLPVQWSISVPTIAQKYIRSNWTTFTKQQEVGNIRGYYYYCLWFVFQNMYLLLIFWFLSVSSNCSVQDYTWSLSDKKFRSYSIVYIVF